MNNYNSRKKIAPMVFSSVTALYLCTGFPVRAEEFIDGTSYEYTNEASLSFWTDCTTIRNGDSFRASANINIPSSDYTNVIWNKIKQSSLFKDLPQHYVTLKGLNTLSGQLVYTIQLDQPIDTGGISLDKVLSYRLPYGISFSNSKWSQNSENIANGITITFDINWGNILKQTGTDCYLEIFKDSFSELSDLDIRIIVDELCLINKGLELNTQFTVTGKVEKCSIVSNSPLSLEYTKRTENTNGAMEEKKVTDYIQMNEPVNIDLPTASTTIRIGKKTVYSNSNLPSQNKPTIPSQNSGSTNVTSILRLYNPNTGEHLFTSSPAERVELVSNGWKNEYCEWNTPATSDHPIYRVYNPNNGDHHYTTNVAEKDMLVQVGWNYEGIQFYSSTKEEGIPIYRLYNPNATGVGSHHYTSNKEESDVLQDYGWNYEGIAWYGILK